MYMFNSYHIHQFFIMKYLKCLVVFRKHAGGRDRFLCAVNRFEH